MHRRTGRVVTLALAALLLAGTSLLAFPPRAHAETKRVPCGSEVTARPGDKIIGTMHKGLLGLLSFDLGTVRQSTDNLLATGADLITDILTSLSGVVCEVTVTVADTADEVPVVGDAAGKALREGAKQLDQATEDTADAVQRMTSPDKPENSPTPDSPPRHDTTTERDAPAGEPVGNGDSGSHHDHSHRITGPASPIAGNSVPLQPAFLPANFESGYAPMRDYSGIPFATPGGFTPAPGVRYGSNIPGYAPEFDLLAPPSGHRDGPAATDSSPNSRVTTAGAARALPTPTGGTGNPTSLPVLLAVVALAASTAGLVRTWVLRRAR